MLEQGGGRGIKRRNHILDTFLRRNHRADKEPNVLTFPVKKAMLMTKKDYHRATTYLKNKERPHKVN